MQQKMWHHFQQVRRIEAVLFYDWRAADESLYVKWLMEGTLRTWLDNIVRQVMLYVL